MKSRLLLWIAVFGVIIALAFGFMAIMRSKDSEERYRTEPWVDEDGILHPGQIYLEPEVPPTEDILREGPRGAIPATKEDIAKAKEARSEQIAERAG